MSSTRSKEGGFPRTASSTQRSQVIYTPNLVIPSPTSYKKAAQRGIDPFGEIGTTGLRQYGGFVIEEWLQQLTGRRAAWAFREMMDNSPVVGSILYAIEWLARGVTWRVEPGNSAEGAEFVEQCMYDMSQTWEDHVSEALSFLPYGWSWHEQVYKRRRGPQDDPPFRPDHAETGNATEEDVSYPASSKYDDGKIGWRKLPGRAQETLLKFHFDGYSGVRAMDQIDWHGGNHVIPIQKSLLFRSRPRRNNPEGYSVLRNAYTSYFALKNIQQIEAIGIERDLAGIPVIAPPDGVDIFSPANSDLLAKVQEIVTSLRRDEYEGVVKPTSEWTLELLHSGGNRQIDTDKVVRRYEQRIAASLLSDFVLVGQDGLGSYAMVDVKADLFGVALDGILDLFCSVHNLFGIPRLLKLNGMDASDPPKLCHSSAGRINLQKVGMFLQQIFMAGAPIPWSDDLIKRLFGEAGLPTQFASEQGSEGVVVAQRTDGMGAPGGRPGRTTNPMNPTTPEERAKPQPVTKASNRSNDVQSERVGAELERIDAEEDDEEEEANASQGSNAS